MARKIIQCGVSFALKEGEGIDEIKYYYDLNDQYRVTFAIVLVDFAKLDENEALGRPPGTEKVWNYSMDIGKISLGIGPDRFPCTLLGDNKLDRRVFIVTADVSATAPTDEQKWTILYTAPDNPNYKANFYAVLTTDVSTLSSLLVRQSAQRFSPAMTASELITNIDDVQTTPPFIVLYGQTKQVPTEIRDKITCTYRNYGETTAHIKWIQAPVELDAGAESSHTLTSIAISATAEVIEDHTVFATSHDAKIGYYNKYSEWKDADNLQWKVQKRIGWPIVMCMLDASGSMSGFKTAMDKQRDVLSDWIISKPFRGKALVGVYYLHQGVITEHSAPQTLENATLEGMVWPSTVSPKGLSPIGLLVEAGYNAVKDLDAKHGCSALILITDGAENSIPPGVKKLLKNESIFDEPKFLDGGLEDWLAMIDQTRRFYVLVHGSVGAPWEEWMTQKTSLNTSDDLHPLLVSLT